MAFVERQRGQQHMVPMTERHEEHCAISELSRSDLVPLHLDLARHTDLEYLL